MQGWLINIINQFGYFGIAFLILLENIFPSIPSELIPTFSGFLTTISSTNIWLAYRTVIWRCQQKYDNGEPCKTPYVTEDRIKAAFVDEMNRVIANKEQVLSDIRTLIAMLTDTQELEEKEATASNELEAESESMRKLVDAYAHALIKLAEYDNRYAGLLAQSRAIEDRIAQIGKLREQRKK